MSYSCSCSCCWRLMVVVAVKLLIICQGRLVADSLAPSSQVSCCPSIPPCTGQQGRPVVQLHCRQTGAQQLARVHF
jgi:hypothetical protein